MKKKKNSIFKTALLAWQKDNAPRLGAALAYYTVFSLAPLLLILIGISKLFFTQEIARNQLLFQLEKILSPAGRQVAESILTNTTELTSRGGGIATIIGIFIIIIGATAVFRQIKNALDTIWHIKVVKRHGHVARFLLKNLLALIMVLAAGILLISSFILTAIINQLAANPVINFSPIIWEITNTLISFVIIALVFAITIKILSLVRLKWRHIIPGALLTSFLFILGKFTFGLYLALSHLGSAYGAAGALIIFLFWIYYSAQIFLFGVELVKATKSRG